MNSKFTPGPWRVECVSDACRVVVGQGRSKVILARLAPARIPEAETMANATLMASAPDLLAALEMILPLAESYLRKAPADPDNAKLEDARAAIVKARKLGD